MTKSPEAIEKKMDAYMKNVNDHFDGKSDDLIGELDAIQSFMETFSGEYGREEPTLALITSMVGDLSAITAFVAVRVRHELDEIKK